MRSTEMILALQQFKSPEPSQVTQLVTAQPLASVDQGQLESRIEEDKSRNLAAIAQSLEPEYVAAEGCPGVGPAQAMTLFNSLNWEKAELVSIQSQRKDVEVLDWTCKPVESQSVPRDGHYDIYFRVKLPALTAVTVFVKEHDTDCLNCSKASLVTVQDSITQGSISVLFDQQGRISSIFSEAEVQVAQTFLREDSSELAADVADFKVYVGPVVSLAVSQWDVYQCSVPTKLVQQVLVEGTRISITVEDAKCAEEHIRLQLSSAMDADVYVSDSAKVVILDAASEAVVVNDGLVWETNEESLTIFSKDPMLLDTTDGLSLVLNSDKPTSFHISAGQTTRESFFKTNYEAKHSIVSLYASIENEAVRLTSTPGELVQDWEFTTFVAFGYSIPNVYISTVFQSNNEQVAVIASFRDQLAAEDNIRLNGTPRTVSEFSDLPTGRNIYKFQNKVGALSLTALYLTSAVSPNPESVADLELPQSPTDTKPEQTAEEDTLNNDKSIIETTEEAQSRFEIATHETSHKTQETTTPEETTSPEETTTSEGPTSSEETATSEGPTSSEETATSEGSTSSEETTTFEGPSSSEQHTTSEESTKEEMTETVKEELNEKNTVEKLSLDISDYTQPPETLENNQLTERPQKSQDTRPARGYAELVDQLKGELVEDVLDKKRNAHGAHVSYEAYMETHKGEETIYTSKDAASQPIREDSLETPEHFLTDERPNEFINEGLHNNEGLTEPTVIDQEIDIQGPPSFMEDLELQETPETPRPQDPREVGEQEDTQETELQTPNRDLAASPNFLGYQADVASTSHLKTLEYAVIVMLSLFFVVCMLLYFHSRRGKKLFHKA